MTNHTVWYIRIKFQCGVSENYAVTLVDRYPEVAAAEMKTLIKERLKALGDSLEGRLTPEDALADLGLYVKKPKKEKK
jgi:hypothetical protein